MNDKDDLHNEVHGGEEQASGSPSDTRLPDSPTAVTSDVSGTNVIASETGTSVTQTGAGVPVTAAGEVSGLDSPAGAPRTSGWLQIFVGPNGIRAGWRLLIYSCLVYLIAQGLRLALRRVPPPPKGQAPRPAVMVIGELIAFIIIVIASVVMAKIEKEKWGHYGLPLRRAFGRDFWFGCLWGFSALAAILGILHLAGAYYIDGVALAGGPALKYALLWGAMFLLVGFFEEFLVRGYLLYTLASGIWFWPAAVITSFIFFAGHIKNQGENWYGLADVFVIGMFLCFTLWRTGDLWFAVGLHFTWDWGQSYFFSVPDSGLVVPGHLLKMHMSGPSWLSGGSAGPEGSAVNLVADVLFFFIFALFYRRRKWLGLPDRRRKREAELRGSQLWATGTPATTPSAPEQVG